MSDTPPEFDLKFLPDWLKEGPAEKNYADYQGETAEPRRFGGGGRDRDDRRGGGPGRGGGPRPGRSDGGPRDRGGRGDRPKGGPRRAGDRRDNRPPDRRFQDRPAPPPPAPSAPVRVEFLPEPNGAGNIARQIKQSGRAYPLFGTGRLFLERPERHRVRVTSLDANIPLHQVGDGPLSFDRNAIERGAFRAARDEFYHEETTQGEPLKGNFSNVARTLGGGLLIGPTNHHSYQPTLRRIYEERFSRRMSFQDFVHQEIEVVSDEQTINDWKEQARSSTTYTTTKEAEPIVFKSASEAEQHFRKNYLPNLVKTAVTLECNGQASRALPDRSLSSAVREMWEKERAFPAGLVNFLRPYLLEAGLHFFKHRKRILYISAVKPVRHASGQTLSSGVAAILEAVEASPKCTRRQLAVKILGEHHEAPEKAEQKAALARDLHYLVHTGNVIEFHDGTLDLPLAPGAPQPPRGESAGKAKTAPGTGPDSKPEEAPEAALEEAVIGGSSVEAVASTESISSGGEAQLSGSQSLQAETGEPLTSAPAFTADLTVGVPESGSFSSIAPVDLEAAESIQGNHPPAVFDTVEVLEPVGASGAPTLASAESLSDPQGGVEAAPVLTDTDVQVAATAAEPATFTEQSFVEAPSHDGAP